MPDLLGATNPVPSYEVQPPRVTTPPVSDPTVQNIVDPDRVVRPDGQEGQQGSGDATSSFTARFPLSSACAARRICPRSL